MVSETPVSATRRSEAYRLATPLASGSSPLSGKAANSGWPAMSAGARPAAAA